MNSKKILSTLESILFVLGEPVSFTRLAKILGVSEEAVKRNIVALQEEYRHAERGLLLLREKGMALLTTKPENAMYVEQLMQSEREAGLSRAALETLSIVAYRGPIGRADIDAIRGVNSSITLRSLLLRGLIERSDGNGDSTDGSECLYVASFQFLKSLGYSRLSDLPDYERLSRDTRVSLVVSPVETQKE